MMEALTLKDCNLLKNQVVVARMVGQILLACMGLASALAMNCHWDDQVRAS